MAQENRHTFVFCDDWFNSIQDYGDDVRLAFYEAICKFAFFGELPQDNLIKAMTTVPFLTIERNNNRFDAISAARSEAGRRGALITNAMRWQSQQKSAKSAIADFDEKLSANVGKIGKSQQNRQTSPNENENINENENENKESSFQESSSYKENQKRKVEKIPFDDFWNAYEKKVGNKKVVEKKWDALSKANQEEVMRVIPIYKRIQPDPKFRKNAETFLNPKTEPWKDAMFEEDKTPTPTHNYENKEWKM